MVAIFIRRPWRIFGFFVLAPQTPDATVQETAKYKYGSMHGGRRDPP